MLQIRAPCAAVWVLRRWDARVLRLRRSRNFARERVRMLGRLAESQGRWDVDRSRFLLVTNTSLEDDLD